MPLGAAGAFVVDEFLGEGAWAAWIALAEDGSACSLV